MTQISTIKTRIQDDMKEAMRAHEKDRLTCIRLILSALKQREVDARIVLSDEEIISILDKMTKQRRESITQYEAGNRPDLAAKEKAEIEIIQKYLPSPLSDSEIKNLIESAIKEAGATSAKDMGKVMSVLKPKVQGRADVAKVSQQVKERLA